MAGGSDSGDRGFSAHVISLTKNYVSRDSLLHSFNTFGANVSLNFTSPENVILTLFLMGMFAFIVVGLAFARYGKNRTKQDLPILEVKMAMD